MSCRLLCNKIAGTFMHSVIIIMLLHPLATITRECKTLRSHESAETLECIFTHYTDKPKHLTLRAYAPRVTWVTAGSRKVQLSASNCYKFKMQRLLQTRVIRGTMVTGHDARLKCLAAVFQNVAANSCSATKVSMNSCGT